MVVYIDVAKGMYRIVGQGFTVYAESINDVAGILKHLNVSQFEFGDTLESKDQVDIIEAL